MTLDVPPPDQALAPDRTTTPDAPGRGGPAPTDLAASPDRPELQPYADALNAAFATGVDERGTFHSPATTNARLADVALADGPEAAAEWLPALGAVRDPQVLASLQTALQTGAPGAEAVLDGQLDPRIAAQDRVVLARGGDFDDGVMVTFPDQRITSGALRIGGIGHAGVLLIDDDTGLTKYYEYGRYDGPDGAGLVLRRDVPNAQIDPSTGRPTKESMEAILASISVPNGGTAEDARDIRAAYFDDRINFDDARGYAEGRMAANEDPDREPYDIFSRNCAHFMRDTIVEGGARGVPWITIPTPNAYMDDVRVFNAGIVKPVDYNEATGSIGNRW